MIHSEGSNQEDSFNPKSPDLLHKDIKKSSESKKYAVIDQAVRVGLLKIILNKESTIKDAAKQFGLNFSTAKAILQTYRKEGRIGKKRNRERTKKPIVDDQILNAENQRKCQSMYDLERVPEILKKQVDVSQIMLVQQQAINQSRTIMSTPNLEDNSAQITLAYYQRELNRQKLINLQLMLMLQQQNQVQSQQTQQTSLQMLSQVDIPDHANQNVTSQEGNDEIVPKEEENP